MKVFSFVPPVCLKIKVEEKMEDHIFQKSSHFGRLLIFKFKALDFLQTQPDERNVYAS
jgi:hypothetical protein